MPDPIVFVSHSRIKEGKLEAFRGMSKDMFTTLEASKPGTVFHYGYVSEDGSELSFVHVFPDASAMDAHFVGAGDRVGSAMEYIETHQFAVYGQASEQALEMLSQAPGVELVFYPDSFGGYLRLAPA
jgi:hypothetical protein